MVTTTSGNTANLLSFDKWLQERGSTRITGYRYRQQGLINTVNIFGRIYVSREEIARFEERASNGEFARSSRTPQRQGRKKEIAN